MTRNRGEKLKVGEVKTTIILYILENNESVSEPDIRKHLLEKFEVKNQGTINDHLHKLEEFECIESVTPARKSRSNFWDITKLEHLKNIRREFPDIRINSYGKSIMVIFDERGYSLNRVENLGFFYRLFFSVSLFDAFLDSDINKLLTISENIFLENEGYSIRDKIKKCKEPFYELYLKDNPDFKPEEDFPTDYKDVSEEAFLEIYVEKFPGITIEMLPILKNVFTIYKDINIDINYKSVKFLLEHFKNHDTFKGLESQDGQDYIKKIDECQEKALGLWIKEDGNVENVDKFLKLIKLEELKVYSETITKYEQPSMFYISENSKIIYNMLRDFYKEQL